MLNFTEFQSSFFFPHTENSTKKYVTRLYPGYKNFKGAQERTIWHTAFRTYTSFFRICVWDLSVLNRLEGKERGDGSALNSLHKGKQTKIFRARSTVIAATFLCCCSRKGYATRYSTAWTTTLSWQVVCLTFPTKRVIYKTFAGKRTKLWSATPDESQFSFTLY